MRIIWKIIKGFLMTLGLLWVVLFVLTLIVTNYAQSEIIDHSDDAYITVNS